MSKNFRNFVLSKDNEIGKIRKQELVGSLEPKQRENCDVEKKSSRWAHNPKILGALPSIATNYFKLFLS